MPYRAFDHVAVRCPKLGSEVTFGYCRSVSSGLPCERTLGCFEGLLPAEQYFRRVLKEETYERCFHSPPKDRYGALLETVAQAKRNAD
ncbi:MAG: hypothetical protein JRI23_25305 [Deltaproteobacteria bacterium]|nr:hypothetical protein [Deltaproteobacteria bacterium]MBW2535335.1 hypothetical protein [Deltaproteobacteria bacterium]